jgi:methylthioribose-1-phosphate isomerase
MRAFFSAGKNMRTIEWNSSSNELRMIDQRILPSSLEFVICNNDLQVADAIRLMVIRGAPAIGVAAAYGMALAANQYGGDNVGELKNKLSGSADLLISSRPTAVNIKWAVHKVLDSIYDINDSCKTIKNICLQTAHDLAENDIVTNKKIAEFGEALIQDGDTIIHHCNTGSLATVDWGTALGVIRLAHERGKKIQVLVDETRPRLQGARLTAWELAQYGIPFHIITDSAAGYFLSKGEVQRVFFGADRVARNGDVANKIGTYMLALAAHENNVPAYSVFPLSTVDMDTLNGQLIPIEEREEQEVLDIQVGGRVVVPQGARARNPAFDVTPNQYITGLITEKGIIYPPYELNLRKAAASPGEGF